MKKLTTKYIKMSQRTNTKLVQGRKVKKSNGTFQDGNILAALAVVKYYQTATQILYKKHFFCRKYMRIISNKRIRSIFSRKIVL